MRSFLMNLFFKKEIVEYRELREKISKMNSLLEKNTQLLEMQNRRLALLDSDYKHLDLKSSFLVVKTNSTQAVVFKIAKKLEVR